MRNHPNTEGFTLIELSIVLVIIGLIVGGVLVGVDLIKAADTRAQVSQIEKFNTATKTFRLKYDYLPGDIPNASSFGFASRGPTAGEGDGNGVIQGVASPGGVNNGIYQGSGETVLFWRDLSEANLIEGKFNLAQAAIIPSTITGVALNDWFPQAKIGGQGVYVVAWSGGYFSGPAWNPSNGINYFQLLGVYKIEATINGALSTYTAISPMQAYALDSKMDDGLPQTGNIKAWMMDFGNCSTGIFWAWNGNCSGGAAPGGQAAASANTCYDNGNVSGRVMNYSIGYQDGTNRTCQLSLKFQ